MSNTPTYTQQILIAPAKESTAIQVIVDMNTLLAPVRAYVSAVQSALPAADKPALEWVNLPVAIYLDQLIMNFWLPSLGNQTPAPETKRSSTLAARTAEMEKLNSIYPKCRVVFYMRESASANWIWLGQEVIQNLANRVNYVNILQPYLSQNADGDKLGKFTQIGIQFVEEALTKTTLPQAQDMITIKGSISVDIPELKKNDELENYAKLILEKLNSSTMLFNLNPSSSVNIAEDSRSARTPVTVAVTTTAINILAANSNRAAYNIYNAGLSAVYIREGAVATATVYDFLIPPGFLWKEDFSGSPRFSGLISGITASGSTSLQVSEASLL